MDKGRRRRGRQAREAGRRQRSAGASMGGRRGSGSREGEGTYSETRRRAPKKPREEGAAHRWQTVHIAPAKRRMMDRMAKLAKGDG